MNVYLCLWPLRDWIIEFYWMRINCAGNIAEIDIAGVLMDGKCILKSSKIVYVHHKRAESNLWIFVNRGLQIELKKIYGHNYHQNSCNVEISTGFSQANSQSHKFASQLLQAHNFMGYTKRFFAQPLKQ